MKRLLTSVAKKILNQMGYKVQSTAKLPITTLLGLSKLPIRTILDVGANQGQFAKFIRPYFSDARILCFEPLPEPFEALKRLVEGGVISRAYNVALGDRSEQLSMEYHLDHSYSSSFLQSTILHESLYPNIARREKISVRCLRLDEAVEELSLDLKDDILLKLDVQGFEMHVLHGAVNLLNSRIKALIVEVCLVDLYERQSTFSEIVSFLAAHKFKYRGNLDQICDENGLIVATDAVFLKAV